MQKIVQFFNNLSFGLKVGSALLFVGVVPIVIVSYALVSSASSALQSQSLDKMAAIGNGRQAVLQSFLQERTNEAATLSVRETLSGNAQNTAGLPVFWQYKHDHADKVYLSAYQATIDGLQNDLKTHSTEYIDVMVYDRIGDRVAQATDPSMATTLEEKAADQPYFTEAMKGTAYFSDIVKNPHNSAEQVYFVSYPIAQYGTTDVIGVVVIKGNPKAIDTLMNDPTGLGETGEAYLVNTNKLMITQSRLSDKPTRLVDKIDTLPVRQALAGKTGVAAYTSYDGQADFGFYAPVPGQSWVLVTEFDQAEALTPVRQQTEIALVFVVVAVIAALGLALSLSRYLGRQVNEIQKVFRAAAVGNFDARAKVFGRDELGRTADGVNVMLERLTEILGIAAKSAQQRFSDVVTTLSDWVWEVDSAGHYTFCSERVVEVLGYTAAEMIGKSPFDFMPPEEAQRVGPQFAEALAAKKPIIDLENTNVRKDGRLVILVTNGVPILDDHGELRGYRGTDKDITERKEADERLRESEATLRNVFENMQDAFYRSDKDGNFVWVSPSAGRMLGYDVVAGELIGENIAQSIWVHPEAREAMIQEIDLKGRAVDYEVDLRRKDGSIFKASVSTAYYRDENGEIAGVEGVFRDITERKQAEERLRESETTLRGVFDNMQDSFYRTDIQGHIVWVSPSAANLLGYGSPEAVIGLDIAKDFWAYPDQRDAMLKELQASGKVTDYEVSVVRKDGSILPVSTSSSYYRDASGQIAGVEGAFRDITQRKQAEEAIRSSERLMRSIIDATKDWIFLKDNDYRYVVVNEAFAYEYGRLTPQEMVGKNDYDLGTPAYLIEGDPARGIRGFRADDRDVIEDKKTITNPFDVVNFRDGNEHIFHTVKSPLYNSEGNIVGVLAVSRDITERKQAEDQVEEQNKALARALEELRGLMAGVETAAGQVTGASGSLQSIMELIAGQAANSADIAEQAAGSAQEGGRAVTDTVSAMGRIRETTQETARRIKRLGEVSQEIGEVVRLIDEIADRVTVLALNASIQAAAAGDAGRGFAVVAEEVQRLAERATGATRQIENLIKGVQGEINEAMVSVEEVTQEVVGGSQLAQGAGDRMVELNQIVSELANLIQHISQTTTRQTSESLTTLTSLAEDLQASVAALRSPSGEYEGGNGHGDAVQNTTIR